MNLRQSIEQQALQFAQGILASLRGASLEELMEISGGKRTVSKEVMGRSRLGRRTHEDITRTLDSIVKLLSKKPDGLRAEQIRNELGLDTREVPRPLQEGLLSGVIVKRGDKRATTYLLKKKRA